MRLWLRGLLGLAAAPGTVAINIVRYPFLPFLVSPTETIARQINEDHSGLCVVITTPDIVGMDFCGPGTLDLSDLIVAGTSITIYAEYDKCDTSQCAPPGGSVIFKMPTQGHDLVWQEDCVHQIGTRQSSSLPSLSKDYQLIFSLAWSSCTTPLTRFPGVVNPYYNGGLQNPHACEILDAAGAPLC